MEWADARVWSAIADDLPPDPQLREWLTHIHVVQNAFLMIWSGGDVGSVFRRPEEFASWSALRTWARAYYANGRAFISNASDQALAAPTTMPWAAQIAQSIGRPPGATTLAETCFQVTSHSTYHRGQVNARLRALGIEPPLVDYIAWLWLGRPGPEWPA